MSITAAQCRTARGMLAWSRDVLTERSRVSKRTIVDFERGARSPHASTLFAIRTAFETGGIVFIDENGGGEGLRFRNRN
jgi:transcriptional regulator with XRE-family HTH domain